ncbi:hypothetical protein PBI_DRMANHATTAN_66 [Arthrobacter phage DrManhattan]|uniref:Uncharacterized protein n=2 Tax=Manhattanvirus drmanhattan TaxID=2734250 RepID=A0A3G2KFL1_9CAUD|nr:hypothetical protein HOU48_gp66 [Arthrobacter phage DrManhattan]AYN57784.1 hypothetical protein PBI_DRMANHATTAN_66 [Arthrobacter phage DrManhattan]QHB36647.1 hypothetical protein SEA_ADOLIN_65 [Arthrobacter phage Adolin]
MPRKQLTPDERVAREQKLPVWAQKELRHLRRSLEAATRELNDHRLHAYGEPFSNTKADPYGDVPINLKNGESVEFRLGHDYHEVVRVRVRDGVLDVNANGGLVVLPKATNHVDLKVASH